MNIKEHMKPEALLKYSFFWSEMRLLIAAVALFLGGIPPIIKFNPFAGLRGVITPLLVLCWIISGIAAAYLLYRWNINGRILFSRKETRDTVAFFVMVVSGFNLGITGIFRVNPGMVVSTNQTIFIIVGILYILSAGYLLKRWKQNNRKII